MALAALSETLSLGGSPTVRRANARGVGAVLRLLVPAEGTEEWREELTARVDRTIRWMPR